MLKPFHTRHVVLCLCLVLAGCGEQEKVTEDPAGRSEVVDPRVLTQRAIDKQAIGAFEEAIEILDKALAVDPKFVPAHYRKGSVYEEWDRRDEAIEAYKRTLEIDPENIDARMGLGAVYAKSVLNDLAVEEYLKVAEAKPGDAEIHFKVALEYWYLQRLPQAAEYYQKTIAINPEYLQAHLNLASVYERMKEWDKALREIAISLQLGKETHNQQAVSIAERKLAFFKGRMNLTAKEMKRRTEPPFE